MARAADAKRVTATVDQETYKRLEYWSAKKGVSMSQYLSDAIDKAIAYENQDYPLPTLEQARLNQMIDVVSQLSSNMKSLESVITSGFDSLLGLVRGDNYLTEHEDGEV